LCRREEAQPQVAGWNYHTKREALTFTKMEYHPRKLVGFKSEYSLEQAPAQAQMAAGS
jgi:hypothetical protein